MCGRPDGVLVPVSGKLCFHITSLGHSSTVTPLYVVHDGLYGYLCLTAPTHPVYELGHGYSSPITPLYSGYEGLDSHSFSTAP